MVIFRRFFYYKDKLYMRVLPSKRLFNSTTIWEIVNRGDIFAVDMETGVFTVIPGKEEVNIVRVATVTIDLV